MNEHLHFTDEEIVDYLDGIMDKPERKLLEMALSMDEELKKRVDKMRVTIAAVKQLGLIDKVRELTTETRRHGETQENTPKGTGHKGIRKIIRYSMAVAAVLVLFFVIRSFNTGTTTNTLYNEAFVDYQLSGVRGADTLSKSERFYQEGNYDEFINWEQLNKGHSQLDRLLLGVSYLKTNHPKEAINWLEAISNSGPYHQDAEFYLALAYLKNNNTKTAASLMQKIHNDPGHPYRNQFSDDYIKKVSRKAAKD